MLVLGHWVETGTEALSLAAPQLAFRACAFASLWLDLLEPQLTGCCFWSKLRNGFELQSELTLPFFHCGAFLETVP